MCGKFENINEWYIEDADGNAGYSKEFIESKEGPKNYDKWFEEIPRGFRHWEIK